MTGPVWNPMAQQYEPKPTLSLADFLLARIAEDEWFAREAGEVDPHWEWASCAHEGSEPGPGWVELRDSDGARWGTARYDHHRGHHITVHDPARVLAECQAKRQIVELHQDGMADDRWEGDPDPLPGYCTRCHNQSEHQQEAWPCLTLRLLALPYGSHRDYDEAWKP